MSMIIVVAGYAYYRTQDYLNGPQIMILSPQNGQILKQSLLAIEGQTKNIADITLNDRKIFIDKDGIFTENILLHRGYNVITIKVADKFKKNITKKIKVIYQET